MLRRLLNISGIEEQEERVALKESKRIRKTFAEILGLLYLAHNAIVVFHDTGWAPGVQKVVKEYVAPIGKQLFALPNMQGYKITRRITTCVQEENLVKTVNV